MCGRYSITTNFEAIRRIFGTAGGGNWWRPRYNVAPTQLAPVVRIRDGQRELVELRWGSDVPRAEAKAPAGSSRSM